MAAHVQQIAKEAKVLADKREGTGLIDKFKILHAEFQKLDPNDFLPDARAGEEKGTSLISTKSN